MLLYLSHLVPVQANSFRSIYSTSHYDGRRIRTLPFPFLLLSLLSNHFIAMNYLNELNYLNIKYTANNVIFKSILMMPSVSKLHEAEMQLTIQS